MGWARRAEIRGLVLTVGSIFSGIGGLDLGLERAGMRVKWMCEIDPFCRKVLRRHWPDVPIYEDIRDIKEDVAHVDVVAGGFPCQPVSLAGKRLAQEDPRWLWPEFARVIRLVGPRYVIVENVPGLVVRGLGDVLRDLAEMGFDADWEIVSAASQGAPHLRERLFIVAYHPDRDGGGFAQHGERDSRETVGRETSLGDDLGGLHSHVAHPSGAGRSHTEGHPGSHQNWREVFVADHDRPGSRQWPPEPPVGRVVDGFPGRVDQLRGLGNAVVPRVAEFVGRCLLGFHAASGQRGRSAAC